MASKYHEAMRSVLRKIFDGFYIEEEKSMYIEGSRNFKAKKYHVDFFIPALNICFEVDGEHHFEEVDYTGNKSEARVNYEKRVKLDNLKNDIAEENGWYMIRVPYTLFKDEEKLEEYIREKYREVI